MSRTLRSRITYANVMSTLAVFIALGGGAWAVTGRPAAAARQQTTGPGPISPGNSVIHACVDNRTGAARIIDRSCARTEHRVTWVNFNGFFESDHNTSSIDITDSGIVLSSTVPGETPQTIRLAPGDIRLHAAGVHLIADHDLALSSGNDTTESVGHNLTTQVQHNANSTVDNDSTLTIHGHLTSTVDKDVTSTIHGNDSSAVDKNQTESVDGSFTTSIGGNLSTSIKGNANTSAIGGTLNTTAGAITNNADLIKNISDGDLDNLASKSLINQAGGGMLISSGGTLTTKAVDLVNKATRSLTNQAGGNLLEKAGGSLTAQASAEAILSAPLTHLGCSTGTAVARLGDPVDTSANPGSISGASTTVFVC
jgi:hypothetical protein